MGAFARVLIVLFIFNGVSEPVTSALLRKYLPLISEVREYYATSSVCFITSSSNQHSHEYTLAHMLSRELSRKAILTLIVNLNEMFLCTNKDPKRGVRPLVVMLFTVFEDVNYFRENIRKTNVSFPIWLLIFSGTSESPLCKYCEKPTGNIFGLRFNTEMLVLCCQDPEVKEWWSIRENKTESSAFAKWTTNDGFKLITTKSLYAKRHEINGTGVRVAIVAQQDDLLVDEDGKISGLFGAVLLELKRVMNFEITSVIKGDGFGSWNPVTKTWSGVIERVGNGEADIGVAEFSITNHRLDFVDFTLPLLASRTQLYFKERDGTRVQWAAYFEAFAYQIWLTIVLLIITSTVLVALIGMRTGSNSFPHLFFEHYLYVWGIFCQQGLAAFPLETSLRIAYCSIFASALVISAAYSASLISFITVSTATLPFSTVEGFANDGSYSLIVMQNSSDWDLFNSSPDPVISKMMKMMKPWEDLPRTVDEGFERVCKEKVGFFTSRAMVMTTNNAFSCKVVWIDTGSIDSLAMIMPAESPYTGLVNYHIQRFQDSGVLYRLKEMYLKKPSETETILNEVTLWGVAPILSVLAGGILLSLVLLLCERFNKISPIGDKLTGNYFVRIHSRTIKMHRWFNNEKKQRAPELPTRFRPRTEYYNNYSTGQFHP